MYITTTNELSAYCQQVSHARVLALDTEFVREKYFHPKLCLIQISDGEHHAVVDPLLIKDLSPLKKLLTNPQITKVFHACTQDLETIYFGMDHCHVAPVFDTQVAASFLGFGAQISYANVVQAYCQVKLAKSESLTDWEQRPIQDAQLNYALDDVRYLPCVYTQMIHQLTKQDRLSWVAPDMAAATAPSVFMRDARRAYVHLKRASSLTRKQLAVAREICAWREDLAEQRNIPRKRILTDEVVLELCRRGAQRRDDIREIRGTEHVSTKDLQDLFEAMSRGKQVAPNDMPEALHRTRRSQETESVLDLMHALVRVLSDKVHITPQVVATKDDLYAFLVNPEHSRLSSGWRWEVAGKKLKGLLAGEVGITVKDNALELL